MINALPQYTFDKISDIPIEKLKSLGIKVVGIDLDNTTVYDSTLTPFPGARDWLERVRAEGIDLVIISNTLHPRAKYFGKRFNCPFFSNSKKPDTKNLKKALELFSITAAEFAMVGDQLFTDVQAANEIGAVSIRVRPKAEPLMCIHFYKTRKRERELLKQNGMTF